MVFGFITLEIIIPKQNLKTKALDIFARVNVRVYVYVVINRFILAETCFNFFLSCKSSVRIDAMK